MTGVKPNRLNSENRNVMDLVYCRKLDSISIMMILINALIKL
jgi:hypothetical protein